MSSPRTEAAVARILGPAPEHWIELRVDGPKGFTDTVKVVLRSPGILLTSPTAVSKLKMKAIIKVKRIHGMNCWASRLFTAHITQSSPSVEEFNAHP